MAPNLASDHDLTSHSVLSTNGAAWLSISLSEWQTERLEALGVVW
ncbi:hypothetical protein ACFV1W_22750 [Kitasatospora sp. NPDC059648]